MGERMMKIYGKISWAVAIIALVSCTPQETEQQLQPSQQEQGKAHSRPQASPQDKIYEVSEEDIEQAMGQTIYVPVYSHIQYFDGRRVFNLAVTLSVRNTDLAKPITITSVRYYDSEGKLVRQYLSNHLPLAPMASAEFFVAQQDTTGGIGANFIVEWIAAELVTEPVVEAVMIGMAGTPQGISFISPGRVIKHLSP